MSDEIKKSWQRVVSVKDLPKHREEFIKTGRLPGSGDLTHLKDLSEEDKEKFVHSPVSEGPDVSAGASTPEPPEFPYSEGTITKPELEKLQKEKKLERVYGKDGPYWNRDS